MILWRMTGLCFRSRHINGAPEREMAPSYKALTTSNEARNMFWLQHSFQHGFKLTPNWYRLLWLTILTCGRVPKDLEKTIILTYSLYRSAWAASSSEIFHQICSRHSVKLFDLTGSDWEVIQIQVRKELPQGCGNAFGYHPGLMIQLIL